MNTLVVALDVDGGVAALELAARRASSAEDRITLLACMRRPRLLAQAAGLLTGGGDVLADELDRAAHARLAEIDSAVPWAGATERLVRHGRAADAVRAALRERAFDIVLVGAPADPAAAAELPALRTLVARSGAVQLVGAAARERARRPVATGVPVG
ncbi:hypothetical protein [Conexibacter sp. CPCC 206217]|uniref:hypothetical protein n=1 Tax=Conexibacter sp. CPCC 206217 TaxID=3064574 RepID=UPI00271AB011|nr:hypothetical protein [Conexibacter sp. CPCC 206217]MDO8212282.1 hypothetical protein [Conexibacter sp. CPCC 206217]